MSDLMGPPSICVRAKACRERLVMNQSIQIPSLPYAYHCTETSLLIKFRAAIVSVKRRFLIVLSISLFCAKCDRHPETSHARRQHAAGQPIGVHDAPAVTRIWLYSNVFDPLTLVDRTWNLLPRLAESWTQKMPNSWRIRLRSNVKF